LSARGTTVKYLVAVFSLGRTLEFFNRARSKVFQEIWPFTRRHASVVDHFSVGVYDPISWLQQAA
jgi:hypothetical protein